MNKRDNKIIILILAGTVVFLVLFISSIGSLETNNQKTYYSNYPSADLSSK
jgi:hypothetical protein